MTIGVLLVSLVERFGLIIAAAFLLLHFNPLRDMGLKHPGRASRVFQILLFGAFGIMGTYSGNMVFNSVANLRAMSVVPAGLFGGPLVGIAAGLMAGGHRILIDIGGFSALPCGLATILEGTVAGFISTRLGERRLDWRYAAGVAFVGECTHMLLVLAISRPFTDAVELVQLIALPMIVVNSIGAALFVQTIKLLSRYREKSQSSTAHDILSIANLTVGYLRTGLNPEAAKATASIIYDHVGAAAVAITDTENVLAHVGEGVDHHLPGRCIRTQSTRQVLETGEPLFQRRASDIGCDHPGCPFRAGIIVPLTKGGRIVGTLKLYGSRRVQLDEVRFELAKGLAQLFSTQLELEDIQIQSQLRANAEIRHLQAQINPHFLFNSLNTIASFCRTSPERARDLLKDLASFMRKNLDTRGFVRMSEELEQVRSYLSIEQARFGERVRAEIDVAPECADWLMPSLLIQPLVENSIRHGISRKEEGGLVRLRAWVADDELNVVVEDDGVGMSAEKAARVLEGGLGSRRDSIGLSNCNMRLEQVFGARHRLSLTSAPDRGTSVSFRIPRVTDAEAVA
ncbi:two-component system sensor histidine kinase LytS [Desulfobaculum xiamenense]|uniref:histidine kinase n=1 Tax=Desulfobaculum xiamenense TaxID=995050 RepID=A0A846QHY3_9BACT|nr:sensor histidine kinase [Desulfobaculum xiamenense]NJB68456.1 two-component system sensor histidine kinase LytS [Desulfobaculum xiamenense]